MPTLNAVLALVAAGISLGCLLRGRMGWCYVFAAISVVIALW